MQLIDNARALYLKLTSNQLNLLAALISAIYAGFEAYVGGHGWPIAVALALMNIGATIARIVAQPETIAKVEEKAQLKSLRDATFED